MLGPLRGLPLGTLLTSFDSACIAGHGTGNPKTATGIFEPVEGAKRRFQTEIRCGDVMIETIRDTEKGKDIAVQVNEVLIPARQSR